MELRVKGIKNHFKLMRMLIHIRPYNGENTKYTYAFKHVSTRGNIGMQTTGVGAFCGAGRRVRSAFCFEDSPNSSSVFKRHFPVCRASPSG